MSHANSNTGMRKHKGERGKGTGGAKVDSENVLAPASSMADASSSKEKAIEERGDRRKAGAGGCKRHRQTKKWCYSQGLQEKYVQKPLSK